MRLKKILLDLLILATTFLGLFLVSQRDRAVYSQQLNHNSLSQKAVIFKSSSQQTIQQTLQKLAKTDLNNYQIQFNVNQHFSYVYAKGKFSNVPLRSGRFFEDNDFKSEVPIVVVGQAREQTLYKPASQAYYQYHQRFLSVVGIVGTNQTTSLDQHIFISASPKFVLNDRPLQKVTVLVDDQQIVKHLKQYRQIFPQSKVSYLTPQNTPIIGLNWLKDYLPTIAGLVGLLLVLAGLTWLFARTILKSYQSPQGLSNGLYHKYRIAQTRIFGTHLISAMLIAYGLSSWQLYLVHLDWLFGGLMICAIGLIGLFYWRLKQTVTSGD